MVRWFTVQLLTGFGWLESTCRLNQTYNMVNNYVNRSGATVPWLGMVISTYQIPIKNIIDPVGSKMLVDTACPLVS